MEHPSQPAPPWGNLAWVSSNQGREPLCTLFPAHTSSKFDNDILLRVLRKPLAGHQTSLLLPGTSEFPQ